MSSTPATDALEKRFRQQGAISGAMDILGWDSATMMPDGASELRAEQMGALASVAHGMLTAPENAELFERAAGEELDAWRAANLREMRREYTHATAVPPDLVDALTQACVKGEHRWEDAKKNSDYAGFLPSFREVLARVRESAQAKAEALNLSPYDALLDSYDPGMRRADIDPIFADLKTWLPGMVEDVVARQARHPYLLPSDVLPQDQQTALGREIALALGFDTHIGRMDTSVHPFCGGVAGDTRITTRYNDNDFTDGTYGTIHETGHALYEQGLPAQWRNLPVGRARGMTLHESQSLLMEKQVGRSPAFIRYLRPKLQQHFALRGPAWEEKNLERVLGRVERSMIRTEADEVTYPLHVILRYELEQALLSGDLDPKDLPDAWNAKMQEYLGITPQNDREGCLQDVHWPGGAIGYFPTYTLGAMTAAQLMKAARRDLPELDSQIERGEFAPLVGWLRTHVHQHGSRYSTPELIERASGEALNPAIFREHLAERYLGQQPAHAPHSASGRSALRG